MEISRHWLWLQDSPWVGLGWELRKREMKAEESSGNWGQNGGGKFS